MAPHLPFSTLVLTLSASIAWAQPASISVVVDVETFDDRLSPFGAWLVLPGYGRVWQPASDVVGDDFYPYGSDGRWVFTEEGWIFDSELPFGWAVFHYGRWMLDPRFGWVWLPGNTWAPAWVTWRRGGSYVGWAPMGPRGAPVVHRDHWLFVESRELELANVRSRAIDQRRFREAASVTRPVHAAMPIGRPVPIREVHGASRAIPPPPDRDQQVRPRPPRELRDAPYRVPPARPQPQRSPSAPVEPPRLEPRRERTPQALPPAQVEPQRGPPRVEPRRERNPQASPPAQVEPQRGPPRVEPRPERNPVQVAPQRPPPAAPQLGPSPQPERRKRPEPGAPPRPSRQRPR